MRYALCVTRYALRVTRYALCEKIMPNTKSAKKELRKSLKRQIRNKKIEDNLKNLIKKSRKAIEIKDGSANDLVAQTVKAIDKAAQKGIIKKNTRDRKKSRLQLRLNKARKK